MVSTDQLSRGVLIPKLLPTENTLTYASAYLSQLDLARFRPFRLVGIFRQEMMVSEWRWDGLQRQQLQFAWQKQHWFSSSISDALARRCRGLTCTKAARQISPDPVSWIRKLHISHDPSPGPFSVCVHRKDAATVSYTEVSCTRNRISMAYRSGSPCLSATFDSEIRLAIDGIRTSHEVRKNLASTSI